MGAGNYWFEAPSSEEWSEMLYVDLEPVFWSDEIKDRDEAFRSHLATLEHALGDVSVDAGSFFDASRLKSLRESWDDENFPGTTTEGDFSEDQRECQLESIASAIYGAFKKEVTMPNERGARKIADATIMTSVGRMVVACAFTYYGDRLAIIVTPDEETHDLIWQIENGAFEFETKASMPHDGYRLDYNRKLANFRRSYRSGGLNEDMQKVYRKTTVALIETGLLDDMSVRTSAWTSAGFKETRYFGDVLMPWFQKNNPHFYSAMTRGNSATMGQLAA